MKKLVLASHNAKKLAELRRIFDQLDVPWQVLSLDDVTKYPEPAETERTFEGNALLKARACAEATGLPALADDSGISVTELNDMPGVRSARWAGPECNDEANLELLLLQLVGVPRERRGARFVCAMAFVDPAGGEHCVLAEWPGHICEARAGSAGFGYDPIFIPEGLEVTSAELSAEQKDTLSHRGKALRKMAALLSS